MTFETRVAFLRRIVLASMANERMDTAARSTYPADIYKQTCLVTGLDPLHEMAGDDDERETTPDMGDSR